jgi:hypothetical protein
MPTVVKRRCCGLFGLVANPGAQLTDVSPLASLPALTRQAPAGARDADAVP